MIEHGLLAPSAVAASVVDVFTERDRQMPPAALPPLPEGWAGRYEALVAEGETACRTFAEADQLVRQLWASMFPEQL